LKPVEPPPSAPNATESPEKKAAYQAIMDARSARDSALAAGASTSEADDAIAKAQSAYTSGSYGPANEFAAAAKKSALAAKQSVSGSSPLIIIFIFILLALLAAIVGYRLFKGKPANPTGGAGSFASGAANPLSKAPIAPGNLPKPAAPTGETKGGLPKPELPKSEMTKPELPKPAKPSGTSAPDEIDS